MKKLNKYIILFLFLQFLNLYSQSEWTDWEGDKFPFEHLYTKYQSVRQILFSDDNKSIFVFYDDNFLRKFDFESGNLVSEKQIPFVNISCADFTRDGKFALIWYNNFITKDSSIIKYDIERDKILYKIKPERYKDEHGFDMPLTEMSVKISPKGDQFIINYNSILKLVNETSTEGIISRYNFIDGKKIIEYDTLLFKNSLYVLSTLFSQDQKYFACTAFSYYRYGMPNNTFMDFSYVIEGKCNGKKIDLACSKSYIEDTFTTSVKDSFQMNLCQFSDDNKLLVGYKKTNNSLYFLNPENDSLLNIYKLDPNIYMDMFSSCFSDSNNFYIFVTKNRSSDEYKSNIVLYDMNTKRIFDNFPFSFDILDIKISIDKKTLLFFSKNDGVFKFNIPYKYTSLISNFDTEQDYTYTNDTVSFIDRSKGNVISWKWDFGDSTFSTLKNPKHIYLKTGVYSVKLIVSDGVYFDTLILQKNIFVRIQADILRNYYLDKIEGEAPFRVQFYDNSKGDVKSYKWYFGDGDYSLTRNPIHIYKKIGYFNVTLIVSDGKIFDTIVKQRYVKSLIPFKAMFELSDNVGQVPLEVRFNDKSIGEIKYYKWYFGDGDSSSLKNPIHLYSKVGVYDVTLVVSDYLFQNELTVKNHIQVFQNLQSSFELSNNIGEAPFRVDFINKSTGEIKSNKWNFGDGASSTLSNTSHTYTKAGNFTVSLVVSDGKTSSTYTKEKFISVSENTDVESNNLNINTSPFSPNPVKDKLFIQISEFNEVDKIQILDIKGRKIIETELTESIDVSSLLKGIYFLKIGDKEWKFLKE